MANSNSSGVRIRAVEHSLRVLEVIAENGGARLSELDDTLDLSKSTIHNHLRTLEANNYLKKRRSTYYAGLRCLTLGGSSRHHSQLFQVARPVTDTVADETGELAMVTTESENESVYLYRSHGERAVSTDSFLGVRLPLHCSGAGKAMLAFMSRDRIESIIDSQGLPEQTPNTITERDELLEELSEVRERGYAVDDEERVSGMRGIAAPITNRDDGQVLGSLGVAGPVSRLRGDVFWEELPELVRRNAELIEINVTYS
jgi:DNA-binding IclR family transcriptional regulator